MLNVGIDPDGSEQADPDNWQASWVDNDAPGAPNSSTFGCVDAAASTSLQVRSSTTVPARMTATAVRTRMRPTMTQRRPWKTEREFDFTDPCPADVNEDGQVGTPDLLFFLSQFGSDCLSNPSIGSNEKGAPLGAPFSFQDVAVGLQCRQGIPGSKRWVSKGNLDRVESTVCSKTTNSCRC